MQERDRNNKRNSQKYCEKLRKITNRESSHSQKLNSLRNPKQHFLKSKRGYSAKGSALLPLALRPRLAGAGRNYIASVIKPRLNSVGTVITGVCIISAAYCAISNVSGNISNVSATSVTLTLPETIAVNVNPSEDNGFAESTPSAVIISTGNQGGYTLGIKAKDDTNGNALVNESNEDSKLNSITETLTADEYKNGKAGNNFYNTWGFKPDVLNSVANTNFIPGPTTEGITIAKTNMNSLSPETFNLAIATKVDNTIAAGNYSNNFVLTATGNTLKYSIKFNNNGGTGGPTAPQEGLIEDQLEVQIESETPTMEGKDFLGWCTKEPKEDGTCTGVVVQPAGCFPLCKCNLDLTLYAMWGTKSTTGGNSDSEYPTCIISRVYGKKVGDYCWTWRDVVGQSVNWSTAASACPSEWHLPSKDEFQALLDKIGTDGKLFSAGWSGSYWASTSIVSSGLEADYLNVSSGGAGTSHYTHPYSTFSGRVRCVSQ